MTWAINNNNNNIFSCIEYFKIFIITLISQCDMYYIINVLDFWVKKSKGKKTHPIKFKRFFPL
jgi:hypothetical protein